MTPAEAVERLQGVLAHLWMVRTFLKHADEIQDDEALLDVPRTLFDYVAPRNRRPSARIPRSIYIAFVANCQNCGVRPRCCKRNITACRRTPISRWRRCL